MTPFQRVWFLALLLRSISVAQGQRTEPFPLATIDAEPAPQWVVKFAPLSLFDPDNTIQFSIERLIGQRNAVQLELGYGWQGLNLWQNTQNRRYSDKEIWRNRIEWRYYLNPRHQLVGNYIAIEGFYKQVNVRESGTIGVGCNTGPCQYYQIYSSPTEKYVWGGQVKFGNQVYIDPRHKQWLTDAYVGLGFRRRTVERFGRPDGINFYQSGAYTLFDSFSPAPFTLLSLTAGIKIGYAF